MYDRQCDTFLLNSKRISLQKLPGIIAALRRSTCPLLGFLGTFHEILRETFPSTRSSLAVIPASILHSTSHDLGVFHSIQFVNFALRMAGLYLDNQTTPRAEISE
jgi:hypothetical protein